MWSVELTPPISTRDKPYPILYILYVFLLLPSDSRNNRMNKAKQLQKSKRSEIWLQQRIGANDGPPKVVGIVPLSADTNVFSVLQECLREASWSDRKSDATGSHHLVNALYLKYKARCSYVVAEATLASALDVARVADILVLVVDGGSAQEFVIDQVSLLDMFCTKVFLL